jgi:hypothetical protein
MAHRQQPRHDHRVSAGLLRLVRTSAAVYRNLAQSSEPPDADPHVRWCGRGGEVTLPPMPISGQIMAGRLTGGQRGGNFLAPPFAFGSRRSNPFLPPFSVGHDTGGGRGGDFLVIPLFPFGSRLSDPFLPPVSVGYDTGWGEGGISSLPPSVWLPPLKSFPALIFRSARLPAGGGGVIFWLPTLFLFGPRFSNPFFPPFSGRPRCRRGRGVVFLPLNGEIRPMAGGFARNMVQLFGGYCGAPRHRLMFIRTGSGRRWTGGPVHRSQVSKTGSAPGNPFIVMRATNLGCGHRHPSGSPSARIWGPGMVAHHSQASVS